MLKEFKQFALRGNVIDLAVAVIIGGAFGKIVSSLVNDVLMPSLGALFNLNFTDLKYVITPASNEITEVAILYGAFIQAVIDFVLIALLIFMMIKLMNSRKKKEVEVAVESAAPSAAELLLGEIRDILKEKEA